MDHRKGSYLTALRICNFTFQSTSSSHFCDIFVTSSDAHYSTINLISKFYFEKIYFEIKGNIVL